MRSSSCLAVYRRCNRKATTASRDAWPRIGEEPHAALMPFGGQWDNRAEVPRVECRAISVRESGLPFLLYPSISIYTC